MRELLTKASAGVPSGFPFRGTAFGQEAAADPKGSSFRVGQGCGCSAGPRTSTAQGLALAPSLLSCPLPPLSHCWSSSRNDSCPFTPFKWTDFLQQFLRNWQLWEAPVLRRSRSFPLRWKNPRPQRGWRSRGSRWRGPTGLLSPWHMCDRVTPAVLTPLLCSHGTFRAGVSAMNLKSLAPAP